MPKKECRLEGGPKYLVVGFDRSSLPERGIISLPIHTRESASGKNKDITAS